MKASFILEALNRPDLSVHHLYWNSDTKTFSAEISELPPNFQVKPTLIVMNPKTGNTRTFRQYKVDMDSTHEDTYGWRYRSDDNLELLIIND